MTRCGFRRSLAACCLIQAGALPALAQGPLATDRPGFGDGSAVVPRGLLQVETGWATTNLGGGQLVAALGQLVVRYGAGSRVEFRLLANSYLIESGGYDVTAHQGGGGGHGVTGYEGTALGFKASLLEADGQPLGRPAVSLLGHLGLPNGSRNFGGDNWTPTLRVAVDWSLSPTVGLSGNLAWNNTHNGTSRANNLFTTLSVGAPVTGRLAGYLGYGGFHWEGADDEHLVEGGLTLGLSDTAQLDLSTGFGVGRWAPVEHFLSAGLALRF